MKERPQENVRPFRGKRQPASSSFLFVRATGTEIAVEPFKNEYKIETNSQVPVHFKYYEIECTLL